MTEKNRFSQLQILNILSLIGVIVVNGLASISTINGYQTGEIAELYPNLFTPAGITFSIWSLIYLSLIGFIIYQSRGLITSKEPPVDLLRRIGYLFFISSLANVGWLLAWHYLQIGLSLLIMLGLLFSLAMIYNRLEIGLRSVSRKKFYFTHLPFSLYTAWITVATLANLTVLMVDLNWYDTFIPAELWTVVMVILAVLVAVYIYIIRQDFYFNLVIIWALLGIILQRVRAEELVVSVLLAAGLGIVVIVANLLYRRFRG